MSTGSQVGGYVGRETRESCSRWLITKPVRRRSYLASPGTDISIPGVLLAQGGHDISCPYGWKVGELRGGRSLSAAFYLRPARDAPLPFVSPERRAEACPRGIGWFLWMWGRP